MVSILVPVYNAAPYLRQCIDSITGQTYTDLQIVLIDDGSTDGSWDILQELAKKDRRLEVYSQSNCGVAATRNRLLDKVRGDFVLFVDSDDWIELNAVETLLREQQKEDYDIVMFQMQGENASRKVLLQKDVIRLFLEHIIIRGQLWNKLFKSHLFDGCHLDEAVTYGEDSMLVWNSLFKLNNFLIVEYQLYHYRKHEKSISGEKFNGRKFSAYTVWKQINQDTDVYWPELCDIARARFASEMAQVLLSAAKDGYKRNYSIKLLQEVIQQNGRFISKTGLSPWTMRLFTKLVSRHYSLVRFLGPAIKYYADHNNS